MEPVRKPTGRQTRKYQHNFRLSKESMAILDMLNRATGRTRTELVELGLLKMRDEYEARARRAS